MNEIKGRVYGVSGPTAVAEGMPGVGMNTVCMVGPDGLLGEVIRIHGDKVTIQVYEDTTGLKAGDEVVNFARPFTATLGPGLMSGIFDGIQRPLERVRDRGGDFVPKGLVVPAVDVARAWDLEPAVKKGDEVGPGDVLGLVEETERITHKVMVPTGVRGTVLEAPPRRVDGERPVCVLSDGTEVGLYQKWPVRHPRPFARKLPAETPFVTGQRVFDTVLPVAEGGCAIVPGGFGTGKTVVEQTIAKYGRSDVIIYVGCGERGNEMSEVLTEFPNLTDPETGNPLSARTIIVVNTSNMPVAAREASIFTGITMAEYFRDMGLRVALLADSISRWAEALREISSRLEELPGEEGFPPYMSTQLGAFYERSGRVECLGSGQRTGCVTVISAVSPPGGDFSEPVTQGSLRFAGSLWALDPDLAYRRHFPAVNWKTSYTLYYRDLSEWFAENVSPEMEDLRIRLMELLQKDSELKEIVQVIGEEALQEGDRLTLEAASLAREVFLRQSVFNDADAHNTYEKQFWMLKVILAFLDRSREALERGVFIEKILEGPVKGEIRKMQDIPNEGFETRARALVESVENEIGGLSSGAD